MCDSLGPDLLVKVAEVARAGGIGAIICLSPEVPALDGWDFPREATAGLPYVFVQPSEREIAIKETQAFAATAAFSAPLVSTSNTAPQIVSFSSRGPTVTINQVLLKPDVAAPGECNHRIGIILSVSGISIVLAKPWALETPHTV